MNQHILTEDGSSTLYAPAFQEHYHSVHGAITESMHVFIEAGLRHWQQQQPPATPIRVFEMGFGTGLNAFLTAWHAGTPIYYESVEAFPVAADLWQSLNFATQFDAQPLYTRIMAADWDSEQAISPEFSLKKCHTTLHDWLRQSPQQAWDVVYFDAFAPATQPELWAADVFAALYERMAAGAVLTTYCAKGEVRRTLQSIGFRVSRLPGPPTKREMLRAEK